MSSEEVKETIIGEKQGKKKVSPLGCLGAIVIVLVLGWALSLGSDNNSDQSPPTSGESQSAASDSTKHQQEINWATADITFDTVKAALGQKTAAAPISRDTDFPKDITNIEVIDHATKPGQKNVHIYFKPGTVWDETDFVKQVGGTAIIAGSILYANPKVEDVALFAQTEMTDQYGKTETEIVTKLLLTRDFAAKVDWKGLADRHTTDPGNIYRIVPAMFIHPGVLKNVKLDEVQL